MYCDVLVELSSFNIDKTFTYKIPDGIKVSIGSRVLVPFANQKLEGFVLDIKDNIDDDIEINYSFINNMKVPEEEFPGTFISYTLFQSKNLAAFGRYL